MWHTFHLAFIHINELYILPPVPQHKAYVHAPCSIYHPIFQLEERPDNFYFEIFDIRLVWASD